MICCMFISSLLTISPHWYVSFGNLQHAMPPNSFRASPKIVASPLLQKGQSISYVAWACSIAVDKILLNSYCISIDGGTS